MKVLISHDGPTAHYFIRMGLARVLTSMGCEVVMWDIHKKNPYDAFDEFEPNMFIGQTYNLNDSLIQVLTERPYIYVIMKGSDYGPITDSITEPVLKMSEQERDNVLKLKEQANKPNFVYIHYHPDWVDQTHGWWKEKLDIDYMSMMNAADIFEFVNGKHTPEFASDICYLGGYWPYKAHTLNDYILPLCDKTDWNIKIFGNQPWPTNRYCGYLGGRVNDVLASATVCPNVHEPHSQNWGYDVIERPFKLLSNRCFVVSDYVEGLAKIFDNEEIVFAKTPEDFYTKIEYYLNNPDERLKHVDSGYQKVLSEHTYFDRIHDIFTKLGNEHFAQLALTKKQEIMKAFSL